MDDTQKYVEQVRDKMKVEIAMEKQALSDLYDKQDKGDEVAISYSEGYVKGLEMGLEYILSILE